MRYLKTEEIIVNDINILIDGNISISNYFSNRMRANQTIDSSYILDKNLMGLSNTAIRTSSIILKKISEEVIAFDWFFFSCCLLNGKTAKFINEASTFYRQYEDNLVGLGKTSHKSFEFSLKVKSNNYYNLMKIDDSYASLYKENEKIREKFLRIDKSHVKDLKIKFPFWWEATHSV